MNTNPLIGNALISALASALLLALLPAITQQLSAGTIAGNHSGQHHASVAVNLAPPNPVLSTQASGESEVHQGLAGVICPASQGEFVPKPDGQAGRRPPKGYNLQDKMGFSNYYHCYKIVMDTVEIACMWAGLDVRQRYSKQEQVRVERAVLLARRQLPDWFSNYQNNWPIHVMSAGLLKCAIDKTNNHLKKAKAQTTGPANQSVDSEVGWGHNTDQQNEPHLPTDDRPSDADGDLPPPWLDPSLIGSSIVATSEGLAVEHDNQPAAAHSIGQANDPHHIEMSGPPAGRDALSVEEPARPRADNLNSEEGRTESPRRAPPKPKQTGATKLQEQDITTAIAGMTEKRKLRSVRGADLQKSADLPGGTAASSSAAANGKSTKKPTRGRPRRA